MTVKRVKFTKWLKETGRTYSSMYYRIKNGMTPYTLVKVGSFVYIEIPDTIANRTDPSEQKTPKENDEDETFKITDVALKTYTTDHKYFLATLKKTFKGDCGAYAKDQNHLPSGASTGRLCEQCPFGVDNLTNATSCRELEITSYQEDGFIKADVSKLKAFLFLSVEAVSRLTSLTEENNRVIPKIPLTTAQGSEGTENNGTNDTEKRIISTQLLAVRNRMQITEIAKVIEDIQEDVRQIKDELS